MTSAQAVDGAADRRRQAVAPERVDEPDDGWRDRVVYRALLRSADIWELTNRARAYDNHVFVVGANAVGQDPAGVLYFGNSHVVTPIGHIVAKAATHEGWVSARLDPDEALSALTPGSNITQGFDHLRDRNLDLIRNHRTELEGPAKSSFPHA